MDRPDETEPRAAPEGEDDRPYRRRYHRGRSAGGDCRGLREEKLRILGIADAGSPHTRKWANFFVGRGHRVHLVSFAPARASDPAEPLASELRRQRALYQRR